MDTKLLLIVILFMTLTKASLAQALDCESSTPFCLSSGLTFNAQTDNGSGQDGQVYGCLTSTPNLSWLNMEIKN